MFFKNKTRQFANSFTSHTDLGFLSVQRGSPHFISPFPFTQSWGFILIQFCTWGLTANTSPHKHSAASATAGVVYTMSQWKYHRAPTTVNS